MISRRTLSQFDFLLFAVAVALAVVGVVGVYSASHGGDAGGLHWRQLMRVGTGIVLCLLIVNIDYHQLVDHALVLYAISILVLVGVLLFGTEINGSKSWLSVAGISIQPSELVKIVLILVLTRLLAGMNKRTLDRRQLLNIVAISFLPILLVILQHDLGTALMFLPILGGMVFVAGIRWKVIVMMLLCLALTAPVGWYALKDYQRQRVLVTLDPGMDPQGVGYQTRQAQIAIGSGGLSGRGIGQGLQSQLGFVPESHTDFIFALLAEETGLLGSLLILLLYLLLLIRLVGIAEHARDRAGILILTGIGSLLFAHVVVNVGMVLGIMPAIGIPLPLLSYGGSSLLATFAALGLALNVGLRRFVYS